MLLKYLLMRVNLDHLWLCGLLCDPLPLHVFLPLPGIIGPRLLTAPCCCSSLRRSFLRPPLRWSGLTLFRWKQENIHILKECCLYVGHLPSKCQSCSSSFLLVILTECMHVWVYILVHRYTCAVRGSQRVSSSVAFQFAFWDSVSLNLDLLFWLAWLAIELMGSCRCSTSAEVIGVCCHTSFDVSAGDPKSWPQALAVALYSLNYLPSCVLGSVTVTGERLLTGFWTEELLSCLIPSPCLSFYPSSPWISVKVPLRPAIGTSRTLSQTSLNPL